MERFAGRFALVRPLGHGGMGQVWLALDVTSRTECALKRLEVRLPHSERDSLRKEFELLTLVRHPAVVSVYAEPERLVIQPEGTARLSVRVKRHDGFAGDVGVEVKNLPPGLFVTGRSGAAGITIGEGESDRTIVLQADPSLSPGIFPIFAVVRVKSERAATMRGIASLGESADYGSSPILVSVEQGARSERQAGRGSGVRPDGR